MANGEDFNNLFSGDYWTPEGYKRRRAGEISAADKLAQQKAQNNTDVWGNIGKALGGINKPIGDFFNSFPANQRGDFSRGFPANARDTHRSGNSFSRSQRPRTATTLPNKVNVNKSALDEARRNLPATTEGMYDPRRKDPNLGKPTERDFFTELMEQIQGTYGGVDRSKIDYSPLDAALKARMDSIAGVRNQANENFDKSDVNLQSMHEGFQNHISTEGANRFNQIADTAKGNLTNINADAAARLQAIKADDMAKRQAMLQNLGIEEAAAAPDQSADVLAQTQASIGSRNEAEQANIEQNRGSNLAYNQGIATSVGQQGVERRGALQQQLQGLLGKLGMAETEATTENQMARMQLEQGADDRQYQQWRDKQGYLQDTLGMMQEDAQRQRELALKTGAGKVPSVGGFGGLTQDLVNTGYDVPEVQNAMAVLSEVLGSEAYNKAIQRSQGYGNEAAILNSILKSRMDPMLALQLATNYSNLGNTSKFEQRPY